MRAKPLLLLSAALMLAPPVVTEAQAPRGQQATQLSLSGRFLAGRVAEADHDYDGGADQFDAALGLSPGDADLAYDAFRLRLYAGRLEAATQLAPAVLARKPGDGFANLLLTTQLVKRGDFRAAEQQLGRIGKENQLGPIREYVTAWLKAGQKDFTAARELTAKLKATSGERSQALPLTIEAQFDEMAGDKAAAEAKYRNALELDRTNLRIMVAAGEGLRRLGKADEARTLFKNFGEKYSDGVVMDGLIAAPPAKAPSPALGIAEILFDIGTALGSDPRNQRTDLALVFLQFAVDLKPEHDFAWMTISALYEQFQQMGKAAAALSKVGVASPLYWQARLRAATLEAQDNRLDQAVAHLRGLVAEKPARIDAAVTLADLLRSKDRYEEALAVYNTAVSRLSAPDERHWLVYFGRGIVFERLKQWPKAEADMKKALQLSPEQPFVLNYLGYSWVDQGLNLDDGMKMLKRATELKPDDGAITDSVGWAYYRLGQFDTAVEWLERASEQKGDDATIVEHLGDAYWHVGRRREARFQWERALHQKPEKDRVPVIQDKLGKGLDASNDKPTVYEKKGG